MATAKAAAAAKAASSSSEDSSDSEDEEAPAKAPVKTPVKVGRSIQIIERCQMYSVLQDHNCGLKFFHSCAGLTFSGQADVCADFVTMSKSFVTFLC